MNATTATTFNTFYTPPAPATFDAGRQPLATLQSNTPERKRSVKGRKHIHDVFFCPKAANPWADPSHANNSVKSNTLVDVPKRIVDVFFSPQANPTTTTTPYTLNVVDVEDIDDDDDVPIAQLKNIALSSLTTGPSNLKRVPRVTKRTVSRKSCDPDDEDLPLSRVKELLIVLGRQPTPHHFIPVPLSKPIVHTLLRPATVPMGCIVPHCPFAWHGHSNAVSH